MDIPSNPELVKPPPSERVRLNQEFAIFSPQNITENEYSLMSQINLETGELPATPFVLRAISSFMPKVETFVQPFNPEEGYHFTQEDLDWQSRYQKRAALHQERLNKIKNTPALREIYENAPLEFEVYGPPMEFGRENNFYDITTFGKAVGVESVRPSLGNLVEKNVAILKPEIAEILSRLRLVLFFPSGSFEGKPDPHSFIAGAMAKFKDFYPIDTGPLPTGPQDAYQGFRLEEGMPIGLPRDKHQLNEVKGMFTLLPKQQEAKT